MILCYIKELYAKNKELRIFLLFLLEIFALKVHDLCQVNFYTSCELRSEVHFLIIWVSNCSNIIC